MGNALTSVQQLFFQGLLEMEIFNKRLMGGDERCGKITQNMLEFQPGVEISKTLKLDPPSQGEF
jgi:hypothetical protein